MQTYTTPGVYFERADRGSKGIAAFRTDIAAFIGIAQTGPVHAPTPVESWEQYQTAFGTYLPNAYLAYAVKAFFENGGKRLYVVRTTAPEVTTTTTGAPQAVDGSASIVASTRGFAPGAVVTASQWSVAHAAGPQAADRLTSTIDTVTAFPPGAAVRVTQSVPAVVSTWRKVRIANPLTNTLVWDSALDATFSLTDPIDFQTMHTEDLLLQKADAGTGTLTWSGRLSPEFDFTQTVTFASGAGSASGDLYDESINPTLRIRASSPGIWGDGISVAVSHSSQAATATSSAAQPAGGALSYVQSVVGFPRNSLVRVYQLQSSVPVIAYRLVSGVDAGANALLWDSPLASPFDVTQPISFESVEFSLAVYVNHALKEIFGGLSLIPQHPQYVESAVVSRYVTVEDLHSPGPPARRLPDVGSAQLDNGMLTLHGGRDGIAALRVEDLTLELDLLEDVDEVATLGSPDILIKPAPAVLIAPVPVAPPDPCCPGALAPPVASPPNAPPVEAAPTFSLDDVFRMQQAMVQHCEKMQFRFAILDPPDFGYPNLRVEPAEIQSWRQRFDSAYAALYFPWVLVRDPLELNHRVVRRIPPSGHVAGIYARTDLSVGVHQAPANVPVLWAQDLTTEVSPEMQGFLNPIGIDCLRVFPGRGLRVFGARTVSSDAAWRYINVRRLVSMIEHALILSLQWVVFEPNHYILWQKVRVAASGFLMALWQKGAFAGNTPDQGFFVKCDATTNSQAVTAAGALVVEIGVAPVIPAEFVIFRIGRTEDVLEVREA